MAKRVSWEFAEEWKVLMKVVDLALDAEAQGETPTKKDLLVMAQALALPEDRRRPVTTMSKTHFPFMYNTFEAQLERVRLQRRAPNPFDKAGEQVKPEPALPEPERPAPQQEKIEAPSTPPSPPVSEAPTRPPMASQGPSLLDLTLRQIVTAMGPEIVRLVLDSPEVKALIQDECSQMLYPVRTAPPAPVQPIAPASVPVPEPIASPAPPPEPEPELVRVEQEPPLQEVEGAPPDPDPSTLDATRTNTDYMGRQERAYRFPYLLPNTERNMPPGGSYPHDVRPKADWSGPERRGPGSVDRGAQERRNSYARRSGPPVMDRPVVAVCGTEGNAPLEKEFSEVLDLRYFAKVNKFNLPGVLPSAQRIYVLPGRIVDSVIRALRAVNANVVVVHGGMPELKEDLLKWLDAQPAQVPGGT